MKHHNRNDDSIYTFISYQLWSHQWDFLTVHSRHLSCEWNTLSICVIVCSKHVKYWGRIMKQIFNNHYWWDAQCDIQWRILGLLTSNRTGAVHEPNPNTFHSLLLITSRKLKLVLGTNNIWTQTQIRPKISIDLCLKRVLVYPTFLANVRCTPLNRTKNGRHILTFFLCDVLKKW